MNIPGNIYGRVLISRVMEILKEKVAKEQGRFRSGGGYVDQIFVLMQLVENYREKRN